LAAPNISLRMSFAANFSRFYIKAIQIVESLDSAIYTGFLRRVVTNDKPNFRVHSSILCGVYESFGC